MRSQIVALWVGIALGVCAIGCGKGSYGGTSNPPPVQPVEITISSTGVSPKTVTVSGGTMIVFNNTDSVVHEMASNPHPQHTDCPELNVGPINPGASATATMRTTAMVCGYHDHRNPTATQFQGTITVTGNSGGGGGGGGY